MRRRDFIGAMAAASGAGGARGDVPDHLWSGYDFGAGPTVPDRLNQGPFGIEQDDGWHTVLRDFFGQKIRLRAELETKGGTRKPVRWACVQPLDADGSVVVQLLTEKDPRWRKGI